MIKKLMNNLLSYGMMLVLVCISCAAAFAQQFSPQKLVTIIRPVRPWPSLDEVTNGNGYRSSDWSNLVQAAKVIQENDPDSVEKTLKDWESDKIKDLPIDILTGVKLFLAIRLAFDFPNDPTVSEAFLATNVTETLNSAWPIVWNAGKPRLVPGPSFYEGQIYSAASDFHEFRRRYKFRNLSEYHPN